MISQLTLVLIYIPAKKTTVTRSASSDPSSESRAKLEREITVRVQYSYSMGGSKFRNAVPRCKLVPVTIHVF